MMKKVSASSSDTKDEPNQRWSGKRRRLDFSSPSDGEDSEQPATPVASSNAKNELSSEMPTPNDTDKRSTAESESEGEGETVEESGEVERGAVSTEHQEDLAESEEVNPTSSTAECEAHVVSVSARGEPLPKRRCCSTTQTIIPWDRAIHMEENNIFGTTPMLTSPTFRPARSELEIFALLDNLFNEEDPSLQKGSD